MQCSFACSGLQPALPTQLQGLCTSSNSAWTFDALRCRSMHRTEACGPACSVWSQHRLVELQQHCLQFEGLQMPACQCTSLEKMLLHKPLWLLSCRLAPSAYLQLSLLRKKTQRAGILCDHPLYDAPVLHLLSTKTWQLSLYAQPSLTSFRNFSTAARVTRPRGPEGDDSSPTAGGFQMACQGSSCRWGVSKQ